MARIFPPAAPDALSDPAHKPQSWHHTATKNIDKSVYVLEIFLIHRARSRHPEGQATSVYIALQRRKFPTSHRYIYRILCC